MFSQRGKEGEREGEKHQCVVAPRVPPTGHLACNPGMCPDWESNQRPFGSQVSSQSTEPHQPRQNFLLKLISQSFPLTQAMIWVCPFIIPVLEVRRLRHNEAEWRVSYMDSHRQLTSITEPLER